MDTTELQRPLRVAVVAGGVAVLRGESLASGRAIALAIAQLGHQATVIDAGQMAFDQIEWPAYDLCCPALPGIPAWQELWERMGMAQVGSDCATCETVASRSATRQMFLRFDVPTPAFVALRRSVSSVEAAARVASLGFPLLVRPDQLSAGKARFVRDATELTAALRDFFGVDDRVLCERFVPGREFAVTLLGERPLPPVDMTLSGAESCQPSNITPVETEVLQQAALVAAAAIGAVGVAQVDLLLDRQGRPWVLEVNAAPSFVEQSPAIRAAQQAGLDLRDVCRWMLADCLAAVGRPVQTMNV